MDRGDGGVLALAILAIREVGHRAFAPQEPVKNWCQKNCPYVYKIIYSTVKTANNPLLTKLDGLLLQIPKNNIIIFRYLQ